MHLHFLSIEKEFKLIEQINGALLRKPLHVALHIMLRRNACAIFTSNLQLLASILFAVGITSAGKRLKGIANFLFHVQFLLK